MIERGAGRRPSPALFPKLRSQLAECAEGLGDDLILIPEREPFEGAVSFVQLGSSFKRAQCVGLYSYTGDCPDTYSARGRAPARRAHRRRSARAKMPAIERDVATLTLGLGLGAAAAAACALRPGRQRQTEPPAAPREQLDPLERPEALNAEQISRYSRQLLLPCFGTAAQVRLCGSSALVIGAGGLGSPVIAYLAGAGIGRLGVIDDDAVDVSNLHRQVIHGGSVPGTNKAISGGRSSQPRRGVHSVPDTPDR